MHQRIQGIKLANADARTSAVLKAQATRWGRPLGNHLVYARLPSIFKAVRAMWSGLGASGLLTDSLVAMVNRRVAILNQCSF